jgi:hypothetical protein
MRSRLAHVDRQSALGLGRLDSFTRHDIPVPGGGENHPR